jgi:hypothetical protein
MLIGFITAVATISAVVHFFAVQSHATFADRVLGAMYAWFEALVFQLFIGAGVILLWVLMAMRAEL